MFLAREILTSPAEEMKQWLLFMQQVIILICVKAMFF
jgi:hypothetical protein